jgi:hypothetical protein
LTLIDPEFSRQQMILSNLFVPKVHSWMDPVQTNPGGDGLVVFIGVAAPVKTPLIGPCANPESSSTPRIGYFICRRKFASAGRWKSWYTLAQIFGIAHEAVCRDKTPA